MRFNCEIIGDLLPLYYDGVCSNESKNIVEEHIAKCEKCRNRLGLLKSESNICTIGFDASSEKNFIKGVKNKIMLKKILISVVSVIVSVGVIFGGYSVCVGLKSPIEYGEDKFTISEYDNNTKVAIRYNGKAYAKVESAGDVIITVDGEEKSCICVRYLESISSKHFESGENRRSIEDGGDMGFSTDGTDCIYYLESGWTDEEIVNPGALADKILEDGVLIWSK